MIEEKTRQMTPAKNASSPRAEALDLMVSCGWGWVVLKVVGACVCVCVEVGSEL
jgi:hypothetical protein